MKIEKIEDKNLWENFLSNCSEKTFLNSWNWGDFQRRLGNKIWRLGIFEDGKIEGLALVVKIQAKRGTFLFIPHGPNIKDDNKKEKCLRVLIENLKEIAKQEKAHFIRIGPIFERTKENQKIFQNLKFRRAPIYIHPEITWELDISLPEDKLLANMRKTTRYLIRKAQKERELIIKEENTLEGIERFYEIYLETKDRHGFVPFSLEYLKNEFLAFLGEKQVSVLFAEYKKEIVAGGIFIFWQNICFYHHGASSKKHQKIPTSYLLLWEAIKTARERSCKKFNFWGIAETDEINHPWAGLTLFKKGFGGQKKEYLKTQDFPLSLQYFLNFLVEKIRKIKRGY